MDIAWWVWVAFAAVVVALLLVDLLAFGRDRVPSFRQAAAWSAIWTGLGVAFTGVLWAWQGGEPAREYFAGFLIEKSLSMDNLFVFALLFAYFAVPLALQRKVLFLGIAGAIVLRALFILAGAALLDAFHAMIYVFGGFLVLTGLRMAMHKDSEIHPERNPVLRLLRRFLPMTSEYRDSRVFVREGGRLIATPLFAALVLVATFDVVFAIDSIPAIFAITEDTFVVFAANAFSLLGLTALYFLLAGMMERFEYLKIGLAVILVLIGAKMLISDVYKVPVWLSLVAIVVTLAGAIGFSLWRTRGRDDGQAAGSPSGPTARETTLKPQA